MTHDDDTNRAAGSDSPDPETVSLTIDGKPVTVARGSNVIQAARTVGIDIPAFCYHEGLSIAACCRQCLVSLEGVAKLTPACSIVADDGMVVTTTDEASREARRQMLEFTLLNHPIDCPVCDKAGECPLQEQYFEHDRAPSRSSVAKVHKPKMVDLGPHVLLDAERCILCTRCIRVCDEVAGEHQLEMKERGDWQQLVTAEGEVLDNPYSLNTVDVCPVGALTSKDFRFSMRAWELETTPSICTGCATGCNIDVDHKDGRIYRLRPRKNLEVNQYWMCDEGRFTYRPLRRDRLAGPLVDGLPVSWEVALRGAAERLGAALAADPGSVGVVLSAGHTSEANYVLARLAAERWQLSRVYLGGKPRVPERADDILRDADVEPNRAGAERIIDRWFDRPAGDLSADVEAGRLRALVILGPDLEPAALAAAGRVADRVVIADREIGAAADAPRVLPCAAWAEVDGTVVNRQGRVQRLREVVAPPGQTLPAWQVVVRLARACGVALDYDGPRAIFEALVAEVDGFAGAEWGPPLLPVVRRFAGVPR